MGNVSGRTEMENGNGGFPAARRESHVSPSDGAGDSMAGTPPASPRRSRSPIIMEPQHPRPPFQRIVDSSQIHHSSANDSHSTSDFRSEKAIPTLISWNQGGNDVAVEGSWDNWSSRTPLHRSGKDHYVLLVLGCGTYNYRFIVDGERKFLSDLPHLTDPSGHTVNSLQVTEYVPENLEGVIELEAPPSPESSYNTTFPVDDDFTKEPPTLPPHLPLTVSGPRSSEMGSPSSRRPHHVELNHLFIEKGWASQSVVALNVTHRFKSKYVTVALYKPLKD